VADDARRIIAYEVQEPRGMPLVRGPYQRDWMDSTNEQFAYRCLPLVVANQAGWLMPCPVDVTATWNGGPNKADVTLDFGAAPPAGTFNFQMWSGAPAVQVRDDRVSSHFGSGTVTFSVPYLFRTPPGVNLWVKGPANYFKDGAAPLEGVVETDWAVSSFTMNWKLTRPGLPVHFTRGEPICMIIPVTRGLAEELEPIQTPITADPELMAAYRKWMEGRNEFLYGLANRAPDAVERGWQKDYFQGRTPRGETFAEHQTRIRLKDFVREPPAGGR